MKFLSFLKWLLPLAALVAIGLKLISFSVEAESKQREGYELYTQGVAAIQAGDAQLSYSLFLSSAYHTEDPHLAAIALYEAAAVGWLGELADFRTLVNLYQQALLYEPGFYEAAFDLEYLYWLRANSPGQVPQPDPGEGREPGEEQQPESQPGTGGGVTNGDI